MSTPEELFRFAAGKVFNTWTALQLAVEHGMGGSQGVAKAMAMVDSVVELFTSKPNADWDEVADLLGEMMDDEFNTICEDDSTDEVGLLLWEFYKHCLSGDREMVESEIAKLPSNANWLSKCINQTESSSANGGDDDGDEDQNEGDGGPSTSNVQNGMDDASMDMEEVDPDPGWTQVHRKRK